MLFLHNWTWEKTKLVTLLISKMLYRQVVGFSVEQDETISHRSKVKKESLTKKRSKEKMSPQQEAINTDATSFEDRAIELILRRVEGATSNEYDDLRDLRPANICVVAEKGGKPNGYLFNHLMPDSGRENDADFVYYNAPEVIQERARHPNR